MSRTSISPRPRAPPRRICCAPPTPRGLPAAPIGSHLLVLARYAGIGCLIVLVTNMLPNRGDHTSEVDLELRDRIEGNEQREHVAIATAVS